MPPCYSSLVYCTWLLPSRLSELFIVNDLFLLPISQCSSSITILGYCGYSATASPYPCTKGSPQRLSDKCTLIHNTCRGLYIDGLIPPRPHCNMNSTERQFKCVMSPTRTRSSTYHIYDMLRHIAGPEKIWKAGERKKIRIMSGPVWTFSLLMRRQWSRFQGGFFVTRYLSLLNVAELHSSIIFTGYLSH